MSNNAVGKMAASLPQAAGQNIALSQDVLMDDEVNAGQVLSGSGSDLKSTPVDVSRKGKVNLDKVPGLPGLHSQMQGFLHSS